MNRMANIFSPDNQHFCLFHRITASFSRLIALGATVLALTTGCSQGSSKEPSSPNESLTKIAERAAISSAYGAYISTGDKVGVLAEVEGRPTELSLNDQGNLVKTDWGEKIVLKGIPISEFNIFTMKERLEEVSAANDCDFATVYTNAAVSGAQVESVNCSKIETGGRYVPESTRIDKKIVVDAPNPRDPEHVASLSDTYAKLLPEDGSLTAWEISFSTETQEAYGLSSADISGMPCKTGVTTFTSFTGGALSPLRAKCALPSKNSGLPFHLSNFDPNLVNIVADRLAAAGIDINQAMTLDFYSQDGTNLTYKLTTLQTSSILNPATTGTITPTK